MAPDAGAGIMTADGLLHDVIFLAEARDFGNATALEAVLTRLGFAPGFDAGSDGSITMQFAGATLSLIHGAAALALFKADVNQHVVQAIGAVSCDEPRAGALIALRCDTAAGVPSDRLATVQRLCVIAAMVGEACGAQRLFWPPAGLWSPASAFADSVVAQEADGLPPVLHLVAFSGSANCVQTRGLAHFCGIELQLLWPDAPSIEAAVRRLARLAIHAMVVGPPQPGAVIAGLERREQLTVAAAMVVNGASVLPVRVSRR